MTRGSPRFEQWRWWERALKNLVQLFVQPEWLGVMLIVGLPGPVALFWRSASLGFGFRLLCASGVGLALWAIAILTIFMPRYRGR